MILGDRQFAASARVLEQEDDVLSVVEGLPGAIGYTSLAGKRYQEFKQSAQLLTPMRINGMTPDAPDYPFVSPVGVAYLPESQNFLQPFLDWGAGILDSDLGRLFARQFGIIPMNTNSLK